MELLLTITSTILSLLFTIMGILERMKPNGKFSTGIIIALTIALLTLVTTITNNIVSSLSSKEDNQNLNERIDGLSHKMDSIMKLHPATDTI